MGTDAASCRAPELLFAACAGLLMCASAPFAASTHAASATAADDPGAGTASPPPGDADSAPLLAPPPYATQLEVSVGPKRCHPQARGSDGCARRASAHAARLSGRLAAAPGQPVVVEIGRFRAGCWWPLLARSTDAAGR